MNKYTTDLKAASLLAITLALLAIVAQFLDGNMRLSSLSFNAALVVALCSSFLGGADVESDSESAKLSIAQYAALFLAVVLGIVGILSSSTVGILQL